MSITKLNSNQLDPNVYNQDNLIAGKNISIEDKTIQEGLDEYTQLLLHFNNSLEDASGNCELVVGSTFTASYADGHFNKCLQYLSNINSSNFYRKKDGTAFDFTNGLTFEFWYYISPNGSTDRGILELTSTDMNSHISVRLTWSSGLKLYVLYDGGSAQTYSLSTYVTTDNWYHLCFQVLKNNYWRVYINGILLGNIYNAIHFNTTGYSYITFKEYEGSTKLFLIDEFRLSNTIRYDINGFTVPTQPLTIEKTVKSINSNNSIQSTTVSNIIYCTQAEYDALVSGGTVDANTAYLIVQEESN